MTGSSQLYQAVKSYLDENYVNRELTEAVGSGYYIDALPISEAEEYGRLAEPDAYGGMVSSVGLETSLESVEPTFSETLLHLIDEQGKKESDVYKKANIDRRHFSKIRNNREYQPSKMTALAFAVALELDPVETENLLARAGFAISHSSKADIIVEYFLKRREYDIFTINEILFKFHQPLLGG